MTAPPLGQGPLTGVRVVELANYVSGPFATMMLSDLGADVVKVEPPKGDPFRRFGRSAAPMNPMFVNSNRGKRVLTLDLKNPAELATLYDLLDDADVLVSNWRPSVAERIGLGDDAIVARNDRLIRVYVTGFGTSGPLADVPVYDAIVQAHVGSAESSPPTIVPTYVVDKLTASMACQATLAALFERERGGPAQRVDLALLDAAAYMNFVDVMANRTFADLAPAAATNLQAAAIRAAQTADGWILVVPVTSDQIRRTCGAIGRAALADELLAMKDATSLTRRLIDEIEVSTRAEPTDHWVTVFREADVPAGPCLTIDQHLADPQVDNNHIYDIADWPELGRVRHVRYPAIFSAHGELWPQRGAPLLPKHAPADADDDA